VSKETYQQLQHLHSVTSPGAAPRILKN